MDPISVEEPEQVVLAHNGPAGLCACSRSGGQDHDFYSFNLGGLGNLAKGLIKTVVPGGGLIVKGIDAVGGAMRANRRRAERAQPIREEASQQAQLTINRELEERQFMPGAPPQSLRGQYARLRAVEESEEEETDEMEELREEVSRQRDRRRDIPLH
jgi:hypothetical protein